tara:strand:+ start:1884 stop:2459 length:576 start_codon:yes stop_codon:yes gene_type:complete
MYEYKETISQLDIKVPNHIEVQLDNLPLEKPYMPRIDGRQAHMFLWLGKKEDDIETYNLAENSRGEIMWVDNKTPNTYIKGVGMFHIYDDYVVVGSLKYAGYLQRKTPADRRHLLRTMWCETINIFKDKDIMCPSGTFFNWVHLSLNQMTVQKEPYHREIMQQFGFKRDEDYWVRNKESKTGLDWIKLYGN